MIHRINIASTIALTMFISSPVRGALTDGLVSYWKLDESSGNAVDAHGTNTGTNNGSVGAATGTIAGARDFVKSNSQYFDMGDPANLRLTNFSIAAWIHPASFPTTGTHQIVSKSNAGGGTLRNYHIDIRSGGKLRFYFTNGSSNFLGIETSAATLSTATWYHVVATWDGSIQRLYVNGALDTTNDPSGTPTPDTTTGNLAIGRLGSNNSDYFDGRIDEVGIWSRPLEATEITALHNGGNGLAYPFHMAKSARAINYARRRAR